MLPARQIAGTASSGRTEGLRSRQRELLLSDRAAQRPQQVRRVPLQAGKALCADPLLQRPDGTAGETR